MVSKKFALEGNNYPDATPLEILRNVLVTYKGVIGSPLSLADITKVARIEPVTVISSDLVGTKELYNILHGVLNIYAAYYLQAISILSTELIDARILKILDKTNPDRDIRTVLAANTTALETLTLDNCKYKLPGMKSSFEFATEFFDDEPKLTSSIDKIDTFEKLGTAVGKVIDVNFAIRNEKEKDTVSMPVVVKLDNIVLSSDVVNSIMTVNPEEIRMGARLKAALQGRISFIKDFILASDLIKNHKKVMFKDNTDTYNTILKRINSSRIYSGLTGNISMAGVSSVFVISENNEQEIIKQFGSSFSSEKIRKMVFDNTMAMMIVVIDREWERVTIYVRDIAGYAQNSFDEFKPMTDKNNNAIVDIFKSFSLGNAPSF